jgi:hypothetical protein
MSGNVDTRQNFTEPGDLDDPYSLVEVVRHVQIYIMTVSRCDNSPKCDQMLPKKTLKDTEQPGIFR